MVRDTVPLRQPAPGAGSGVLFGLAALLLVLMAPSPAAARLIDGVAVTAQACTVTGGGGADSLGGTAGRDVMCGLGGGDRLRGNGGHDVVLGGGGGDLLQGKGGSDRLDGGPGNDRAFGGAGADDVRGGSGNDVLGGGLGPDGMSGGSGRDIVIYGQRGAPVIVTIGAGANDGVAGERDNVKADVESVQGGRGNDVLTGNGGSNRLFGGGGNDRVVGKGGSDVLVGAGGDDRLDAREGATAAGRAAQAGSVDRVVCGAGNDTALVDPVDVVAPDCENVIGAAGATPPPSGGQPPGGTPPQAPQNRAPTGITLSNETVDENRPAGTDVGTFSASDPDPSDTQHAFALVPGDGDDDNDSFEIVGTTLKTTESFDFEDADLYLIRVRATDFGTPAGQIVSTFEISITDVNEGPTAIALSSESVAENEPAGTTVGMLSASDPDAGDTHSFALVPGAGSDDNGSFEIVGNSLRTAAMFDYETKSSYSVRVRATDFGTPAGQIVRTFTITVTDVNDPPTAVDDSTTVGEDSAAGAIDVLANDTDTDGGAMTIASASDPANGTVVLTGGSPGAHTGLTYKPDPNYCSATPDTFTYELNGGSTGTVSVTVTCVDDLPVAVDDAATVPEDSAATPLAVLANDSDVDGDPTTIASASDPANGTVVLTGGLPGAHTGLTYQPDPNFCSATPDTFTYTLNGGATATVSVTVTCGDDAPTAVDDTATVGEDSAAGAIDVLANDTDSDGGAMVIASASDPANGAVVLTGGSAGAHTGLTYQPDPNFCGPDSFTYTLNGGSTATVSVTVTCVDDAPTAVDDSASVVEDSPPGAIAVLANDTDTDGGPKSVASVMQPANGTVVITGAGSGLTYQPNANYCSATPDSFTYTLNGGDSATVSVTVTCVDDPPTAVNDSATVAEDAAATAVDVLANDTDVDGGSKLVEAVTPPTNGTVVITGDGTGLTYEPDAGYCNDPPGTAPDVFTYTLNGGSTATVSVTVSCNDNPPTAVDDSATVAEDSGASAIAVLANDTDTDGGPKTIAGVTQPTNGAVVITGGGSGLTYQPNANYCNSPPGGAPDTFTYTLNGGDSATVSVTVTCVDDAPTAVNDAATVVEDSAAGAVAVLANDLNADGGPITISSASDPANGTVAVTGGGTGLTYQPDANYCGPDSFTYTLNGGSTATVSMTVTCAPDNPVVDTSAGNASYTENAAATAIDATVSVTDPDAGTTITGATVKITGGYAGAEDVLALGGTHPGITLVVSGDTLTLSGNASVAAYQAALRAVTYSNGSDAPSTAPRTVTFTVTDDTARTGSDTKGLTVAAVDDPPTAVGDSATVLEDAAATAVAVLTNDTDVDAGAKSVASVTQPANGTVVITGGGTGLTYQPNPNYCNTPPGTTPSTFTYTLNGGSSATVSVTVTCVNDAPVADDETFDNANGAIGNTSLVVNAPGDGAPALSSPKKTVTGDILAGDSDIDGPGPLTATAGTFATNDGGSVTIEADGDFIYINDPADNCADTSDFFDYTLSDQNPAGPGPAPGTDTGRVTIAIAGCVWYVSNNATGNSGSSIAPFDTLTQAETASAANHTVFVFDGDNTSTGYGGNGYTMNAGERLIGEHEGLTVDPDGAGGPLAAQTLHPANPGAHPTLTATGADVIDLDDANEVRGLTLDPSGAGGGIAGATGDVSGTIDDVNITDTGTAGTQPGLELDATTGSFAVSNLAVSTTGATGVRLNNAGTVTFAPTGNISITSAGAPGLTVTGTVATPVGLSTSTFDTITVTGSTSGTVSLTNTTGTTTFGDLALTTTSGATAAFALSNAGTVSVPAAGTTNVSATGGPAVDVTGTAGATLAFDAVSSTNSANDGINLAGLGTGTFSAASGTIAGAAGIAFDLDGGSGAVSYAGTIANSATGRAADITSRTGNTTLSGNITGSGGTGINVSGNSAGTTSFSGTTKTLNTGANPAVTLASNPGHTIAFTGGALDIDTTSGGGVSATGGGTVTIEGSGNTITTATGTGLNVANTAIGSAGLNFTSINVDGNDSAPANGIVLNNTGTGGGLTVSGNGSAGSGGTVRDASGDGILLTTTEKISLSYMTITSNLGDGIGGSTVNGFALDNDTITSNGNDAASDESGINLAAVTGTVAGGTRPTSITNTTISNNNEFELQIRNTSGTLADFRMSGNTISSNGLPINGNTTSPHGNLVNFLGGGTSVMTLTVTSGAFTGNWNFDNQPATITATAIGAVNQGTSHTVNVSGATFTNNNVGVDVSSDPINTTLTFNIQNNTFVGSRAVAINSFQNGNPPFDRTVNGRIQNNTIGTLGVAASGSRLGNGISIQNEGAAPVTMLISGNTIQEVASFPGISSNIGLGGAVTGGKTTNLTITNNVIRNIGSRGIALQENQVNPPQTPGPFPVLCANVSGNTFSNIAGQAGNGEYMRFRELSGDVRVVQATPTTSAINTEIDDANGFNDPTKINISGGVSFSQAACPTPP